MSRSREQVEEHLLVAYMSGELPDALRKEISAYLARHQEARELLALAHEALDAAEEQAPAGDDAPDPEGDGAEGDGTRHSPPRAADAGDGPSGEENLAVQPGSRKGVPKDQRAGAHIEIQPRTGPGGRGRKDTPDSDVDGTDAGPSETGKNSLDDSVDSAENALWRINTLIASAVLVIGALMALHVWTSHRSDVPTASEEAVIRIGSADAVIYWGPTPGAVEYRLVDSASSEDAEMLYTTVATEVALADLRDASDRIRPDETVTIHVEAVDAEGNVVSRTNPAALRLTE